MSQNKSFESELEHFLGNQLNLVEQTIDELRAAHPNKLAQLLHTLFSKSEEVIEILHDEERLREEYLTLEGVQRATRYLGQLIRKSFDLFDESLACKSTNGSNRHDLTLEQLNYIQQYTISCLQGSYIALQRLKGTNLGTLEELARFKTTRAAAHNSFVHHAISLLELEIARRKQIPSVSSQRQLKPELVCYSAPISGFRRRIS